MEKMLDELYDLCGTVCGEIKEANDKIRSAGGKLSGADLDYLDKLTHTLKSVKTTIAMIEADEDGGESNMYPYYMGGRAYQGGSNRGRSNAQRRDGMGRYSRARGYSRDDARADMVQDLHDMMQDAPDETTRKKLQRFIGEIEGA